MNPENITQSIASLPPEARKEVIDFVAFLQTRYPSSPQIRKTKPVPMAQEPFIGMWQARRDIQDSTTWVRNLRKNQWPRGANKH